MLILYSTRITYVEDYCMCVCQRFFVVMYPGKCTQEILYSPVMLILNLPAKVIPLFLRSLSYSWLKLFLGFVFPLLLNWLMLVRLLSKQIKVVYRCNVLVVFFCKIVFKYKRSWCIWHYGLLRIEALILENRSFLLYLY